MSWLSELIKWKRDDDKKKNTFTSLPKLKCATCHRFVDYVGQDTMDVKAWMHSDDASEICMPVGVYRD